MKPKIIVIVGPTASGKSALAEQVAKKFDGEILCVDSRTVYRGMDIGTAKSVVGQVAVCYESTNFDEITNQRITTNIGRVRNYGIDLVDPNEEMNGALFKEYTDKVIADIVSRGKLPILCGGTGLWVDMIVDNLAMPEVEPDLGLRAELEKRSVEDLFAEFAELDPVGAEVIDRKNKRRLLRALEVCKKTGQPFSELRKKGEPKYDALWFGLDFSIDILNQRIGLRVDEMIKNGLVDEVKILKEKYGDKVYAMSGIGYQEICRYLNNEISLDEAIEEIKKNTRQYAKRQRTWFKRNERICWVGGFVEAEEVIECWLE